jgi:hypothetical protein
MMKRLLLFGMIMLAGSWLAGQELNVTVKINTQKLQNVDPAVFTTLEGTMLEFLNSQKWTDDIFEREERINCNILLTIQEELSPTRFKADLAIQSTRPVYNSEYETQMLNHIDRDVTFSYEQFQPIIYSKNAYNDNLSSVMAFYAYIVLGLDYDSFSLYGGDKYFQIAQDILNNIPQGAAAANPGWRSLDGDRNRFWMIENILSPRARPMREGMYKYHRQGLDIMADDPDTGRAVILQALDGVRSVVQTYPNSLIVQMFSNSKSLELVEIFKRGPLPEKNNFIVQMSKIDPTNAQRYRSVK